MRDPPGDDSYCDVPHVGDVYDESTINSDALGPEAQRSSANAKEKLQVIPFNTTEVSLLGKRASKHSGIGLPWSYWAKESADTTTVTYNHPIGPYPQGEVIVSPTRSKKMKTNNVKPMDFDDDDL